MQTATLDLEPSFPQDLRQWLDEESLVKLVFEALHAVEDEGKHGTGEELPIGKPRNLLSVLTYSYAIGLYSSDAIQMEAAVNRRLSYLAAKTCPTADELRGFRRHHRAVLQESLSRLLQAAWRHHRHAQDENAQDCSSQVYFGWLAEQRINQAVLMDTMALDQ